MSEYSLNELLLMRRGRGFSIDEIRRNKTSFKNEKDADRTTFFRYLEKWGLKEIFIEYYNEKNKKLSESCCAFFELIFSINSTGYRPKIGIISTDKKSKKSVSAIIEESEHDIKNSIRKGLGHLDLHSTEIQETYNLVYLALCNIFDNDSQAIKDKYTRKLRNTRIALELENIQTYEPTINIIKKIPKSIIDNQTIPQDSKYALLEEFYRDCGKLLDKWEKY